MVVFTTNSSSFLATSKERQRKRFNLKDSKPKKMEIISSKD
jgi:hypothetical protein